MDAAYDSGDGLHPNATGHQEIADTLISAIAPYRAADIGTLPENTPIGYFGEKDSTNRLTYSRDYTNASWTKTNITAALDAEGINGLSSGASSLTATAGNGTCFNTITLTSAARTFSVFVKRKTGTGTIEYTDDGGATYTNITSSINSSTYTRLDIAKTQANPSVGFRITTSADAIEVDGGQVEDGSFATSIIQTTTAAVTRNKDDMSYPTTNIPVNDCVFSFDWTPTAAGQGAISMVGSGDVTNEFLIWYDGTSLRIRKKLGAATNEASKILTYSLDTKYSVKGRFDSVNGIDIWIDDVKGTNHADTNDAIYPSDARIGSRYSDTLHQTGGINNFTVYEGRFTDAEVVALP